MLVVLLPLGLGAELLRRGYLHLASWAFVSIMWISISALVHWQGGLNSPVLPSYLLVALITGLLLSARASFLFIVLSAFITALWAWKGGFVPVYQETPWTYWVGIVSNLIILSVVLHLALRTLTQALREAEVAQAQTTYQANLLQQVSDAVIATDLNFHITSWNKGAEAIYGWHSHEVMGKQIDEILHTVLLPDKRQQFLYQLHSAGFWYGDLAQQDRHGLRRYVTSSVTLLRNEKGEPISVVAFNQDITSQKETEIRYQELFEAAPVMSVVTKNVLNQPEILNCNRLFSQVLGYQPEELIGQPLSNFYTPESRERLQRGGYEMALQGKPVDEERVLVTRDGRHIVTMLHTLPQKNAEGTTIGTLAMFTDISRRKVAERQVQDYAESLEQRVAERTAELAHSEQTLRQQTQILEAILNSMAEGVIVTDETGRYLLFNPAAEKLLGGKAAHIRLDERTYYYGLYLPDGKTLCPAEQSPLIQSLKGRVIRGMELRLRGRDKSQDTWLLYNASPLPKSLNEGLQVGVLVFHDITAQKNAQQSLEQQTNLLREKNEELDAFGHTVAHDLKNPLAQIMGYSEMLVADFALLSEEERFTFLDMILRGGQKMNNIINELLILSSVRREEVYREAIPMGTVIRETLSRLSPMITDTKAIISLPEKWPLALGYSPWLEEVWINYVSNALKYGGHPPSLEFGVTWRDDGLLAFWLQDNGQGLSAEQKARIFHPFTRLDRGRARGHGLGLSIVQRIIEKLGGQVFVESEPGQGSRFGFILPAVEEKP